MIATLLLSTIFSGCSAPSDVPAEGEVPGKIELPTGEPGIRGVVTIAESGTLRVETNPDDESGSPKAVVRFTPATRVMFRNGEASTPDELTLGHSVSVWFDGPVMESYPVQGSAAAIVIEPVAAP